MLNEYELDGSLSSTQGDVGFYHTKSNGTLLMKPPLAPGFYQRSPHHSIYSKQEFNQRSQGLMESIDNNLFPLQVLRVVPNEELRNQSHKK